MALSGYIETDAYNASDGTRTIVLEWSATQSGAADNYSDVSWTLRGGGTSAQGINAKNIQAQIHTHATGLLWTTATRLYNGTVIASGTVRVNHNADGTASFYIGISGYIYNYGSNYEKTASDTPTLDTINRYFWTDFNAWNPNGVQDFESAYFNVNWSDGADWWTDITNEQGHVNKLYGTYMELHNIRPYYPYYELDRVTGATEVRTGVYGKTITDESTVDIYMKYRTYTMNYDANGGSNAPATQTFTYEDNFTISSDVPTREGYNFIGWSLSSDATQATYPSGYTWGSWDDGSYILYAVWQPNTYTITFDGNGGVASINSVEIAYETKQNNDVSQYIPTRQAYEFLGWYTSPIGGVQVYDGNGLCTNDGVYWENDVCVYTNDYTLYAQWKALNIAYYKHNGEWVLCSSYIKSNGTWNPALIYVKSNNTYVH